MFDDVDGPEQTQLAKILIVLAIAIPVLIEVATFGSLVGHSLLGGGGDTAAAASTPTETIEGASVGDEVLPETALIERIDRAAVATGEDGWQFVLTLNVSNPTDSASELRLGTVETRDGETVPGTATTGELSPGETGTVTGVWVLPKGHQPQTVAATALSDGAAGPEVTNATIELGSIQVSNG